MQYKKCRAKDIKYLDFWNKLDFIFISLIAIVQTLELILDVYPQLKTNENIIYTV